MSMNEHLARQYGTNGYSAQVQETAKEAAVDLFIKVAQEQGVDLDKLGQAEIQELFTDWSASMAKIAEEEEKKEEEKEKLKERAKEEHDEKKEAQAKIAEADHCGRVMAHAYVNELQKIAESQKEGANTFRDAGKAVDKGVKTVGKHLSNARDKVVGAARKADDWGASGARRVARIGEGGKTVPMGASPVRDAVAAHGHRALGGAAALGVAGVGGKAVHDKMKEKGAEAIQILAHDEAVKIAAAGGWDAEECSDRILGLFSLGIQPTDGTKVAAAPNDEAAIYVHALELLESAGYPVSFG